MTSLGSITCFYAPIEKHYGLGSEVKPIAMQLPSQWIAEVKKFGVIAHLLKTDDIIVYKTT